MKALALVEAQDHVCCRYRISAFERALRSAGWSLVIEPLAARLLGRMRQIHRAGDYDAVILQRKLLPGWQISELRRRTHRLIYDFDDAVLYRDSYDPRGPHDRRRRGRFKSIVQVADEVIAGNAFLASRAIDAGAGTARVRIIPTCVDTEVARPCSQSDRDHSEPRIDLVWIGSSSTMAGLDQQRPLWERVGGEVPGIRLKMICDRFLQFDRLEVAAVPWAVATENEAVAGGDVGVSWMPDDLWSRGKCGLKVLQYQAAGLPVVANPVGVHRELIRPGVDGLLPTTTAEWVEAIRTLTVDHELRLKLGKAARAAVDANFSVAGWSDQFVHSITGKPPILPTSPRRIALPARSKLIANLD